MKRAIIALVLALLCQLTGCMQNNGHIGPLFGSWVLTGVTEDGEPVVMDCETVFCFQSELVQVMKREDPPGDSTLRYGNFSISGDVLTMKFQKGPTSEGKYMFVTPDWLHFPLDGNPIHFDVRKLNGSRMELALDTGGKVYVYYFKKTW